MLIAAMFTGAHLTESWAFVNSVVVAIQTLTYFAVLKREQKSSRHIKTGDQCGRF